MLVGVILFVAFNNYNIFIISTQGSVLFDLTKTITTC